MMTQRRQLWALISLSVTAGAASPLAASTVNPAERFTDFRALWVTRFDYRNGNASTVRQIVQNAASLGVTDLVFQVRGEADAYYDSNFEPRAEGLVASNWDPLQVAVDEAHAEGMKLHAWINAMPLWRNTAQPVDSTHTFFNSNPSFRRFDLSGNVESPLDSGVYPKNGEYASVNPLLPEVHAHLNDVVGDIVSNYDVDGVHLDYIRWLGVQDFAKLPHDAVSHAQFLADTGLDAADASNATAYRGYIRDRISDLVATLRGTVHAADPAAQLSAAVWRDPDIAFNERLQDYRQWLQGNDLDLVMPMIYLSPSNNSLFEPNLLNTLAIDTDAPVAPGIGVFLHDNANGGPSFTVDQLEHAFHLGADGATLFAYSSFFTSGQLGVDRQNAVRAFYDALTAPIQIGDPQQTQVLADFETGEGPFNVALTFSGSTSGVLAGSTAERSTEQAHGGDASQKIVINGDPDGWFARHLSGIGSPGNNTAVADDGWIGLWILTADDGLSVSLALDDPSSADRGFRQEVIADGQWHLYEWDLDNDFHWEGWVNGDGAIAGPTVTMDSLMFFGAGDMTFFLDDVSHNPDGSLQLPLPLVLLGDANNDGLVSGLDLIEVQQRFGNTGPADGLLLGDANDDGQVTGIDLISVQQNFGAALAAAVPEPVGAAVLAVGFVVCRSRPRFRD